MAQRSGQSCLSMPRDPGSPEYPDGCNSMGSLGALDDYLIKCRACPRLVEYRETVTQIPPPQSAQQEYWAKPVPGFGDPSAKILVTGLAPSATGSNRTGRMFTGDKSADFLIAGFYRVGFESALRIGRNRRPATTGSLLPACISLPLCVARHRRTNQRPLKPKPVARISRGNLS